MSLFLNMNAKVTLGNVALKNVNKFEISENILETSNTATITIPKNYAKLADKHILENFKVGDKVVIESGYDTEYEVEFNGYISEIESDIPIIIHCEDESYILRQTNYIESYPNATLKQVLNDVIPANLGIKIECPDVKLGKYQIDKASAFNVLQDLMKNYGLFSRLNDGVLRVGLAYDFGDNTKEHHYIIGQNVKKNELKYKRKDDFKVRYKAVAVNPNGKNTTVTVGSKDLNASERTLNFAGPMSESDLKKKAMAVMAKTVYDGYTGNITGFGYPRTHAGDALVIKDSNEPERGGKYLIEKVEITYDSGTGFARQNALGYKI